MIPSQEMLEDLYGYDRWATGTLLDAVAALPPDGFARAIGGSFGSLQATFAHLVGADWVWLERWQGRFPRALPEDLDFSSVDAVRARWSEISDGRLAFVRAATPVELAQALTYVNFAGQTLSYPLGSTLLHVANHATYHRGQVAAGLRQLGEKPPSTDYIRYLDARPQ